MRIIHTADWHLGDRIGSRGIDRTADIRRVVGQIAEYCAEERADVLIVAGDLFSDKLGLQKDLSDTIDHLGRTFRPFLQGGGTILTVTGNHDKEIPCQTLKHTLALADPKEYRAGELVAPGRLYLATGPSFFRLADRGGREVQFLLMPYPTPTRYFDGSGQSGGTCEEVNRRLQAAYSNRLAEMMAAVQYRTDLQSVLIAHIHVRGAALAHATFRISEEQDVLFNDGDIPAGFAYVALGHIHRAQCLGGLDHVRYSGSPERLDLGERDDAKSVAFIEIGPEGRIGTVRELPLEATAFHDVVIDNPAEQIPHLSAQYPDAETALVRYRLEWRSGQDNRDELVRGVEAIFPRSYDPVVEERGRAVDTTRHASLPEQTSDPSHTVLHFLEKELDADPDRDDVLTLARDLLQPTSV